MNRKIRVAFRLIDSRAWQGGYNYLLNLCRLLSESPASDIQPVVFSGLEPGRSENLEFQSILKKNFIEDHQFSQSAMQRRRLASLVTGVDRAAAQLFSENEIDVVFENADYFGANLPLPVVAWFPDFQHRHLSKLFSQYRYWRREIGFRMQLKNRKHIMVSSEDAKRDCLNFYPSVCPSKLHVIRFAIPLESYPPRSEIAQTFSKYQLPDQFFFLPNQFWSHKNHAVILEAAKILKKNNFGVPIVVTGGGTHPSCVPILKKFKDTIVSENLAANIHYLGSIPYQDIKVLLATCSALLNPSFFEGWSTTIEEAKAYGAPMILSSINVHKEQVKKNGIFFDPNSPIDLATQLMEHAANSSSRQNSIEELENQAKERLSQFLNDFSAMIHNVIRPIEGQHA